MSRLIDADVLIERIYEYQSKAIDTEDVIHSIKTMPTAYNIEKVMAELEEERVSHLRLIEHSDNRLANAYDLGRSDGSIKAKEIVRKGGAE